jgi:hypothetical protein
MNIKNEDVKELVAEIPEGHRHLRTTIKLNEGMEVTFQEATIANLVRAYVCFKTHPTVTIIKLKGRKLGKRKTGYADWQLLET